MVILDNNMLLPKVLIHITIYIVFQIFQKNDEEVAAKEHEKN